MMILPFDIIDGDLQVGGKQMYWGVSFLASGLSRVLRNNIVSLDTLPMAVSWIARIS